MGTAGSVSLEPTQRPELQLDSQGWLHGKVGAGIQTHKGTSPLLLGRKACFLLVPDQIFLPFFPFLFPRGSSKIEEACEIYARAANMFKMAKNWSGT